MTFLPAAGIVFVLTVLYHAFISRRHRHKKLPPGPKPHFILGNALDLPTERRWEVFAEWKQKYGDVIYLKALGKSMLILNSQQACVDLLEKRSAIYSHRARLVMGRELMGWDWAFSSMEYSPRWRTYRRLFRQFFNEETLKSYAPMQEKHVRVFLRQTLKNPRKFRQNVRLSLTEIILSTIYGIQGDENIIRLLEDGMRSVNYASIPGRYLVDLIPILKYVPSWFPGAGFKRQAAVWRVLAQDVKDVPAQRVKESIKTGTATPSIFGTMLASCEDGTVNTGGFTAEPPETMITNVMGQSYFAASDTTLTSIAAFFIAIANHPEVQLEAQAEINRVIGTSRLPTANDIKDLPYIHAIVKETLRWHSPVPLSLPHVSTEDDEYRGYFIPKGTIIFPNVWAILHNPDVYHDPYVFNPSRWLIKAQQGMILNPEIPDPNPTFGYGRRTCPGQFFAQDILFLLISNVLASFKISPLDADGKPIDHIGDLTDTTGFLSFIGSFNLSVEPLSDNAARLILETE